jgi:hypothetical protein
MYNLPAVYIITCNKILYLLELKTQVGSNLETIIIIIIMILFPPPHIRTVHLDIIRVLFIHQLMHK